MIKLNVIGSWVYVETSNSAIYQILKKTLRAKNPQAYWDNKRRNWPNAQPVSDYFEMYDAGDRKFPLGLLKMACKELDFQGLDYSVVGGPDGMKPEIYAGRGLKDYYWQTEAVETFFNEHVKGLGILSVPTRGGKTLIGLKACSAFAKDYPVLYLVNKTEAQKDVIDWWKKSFDLAPVFAEAGEEEGLHVLTYQAANNRNLSEYRFVVGDEIHQAGADTFYDAIMRCEKADYKMGMTGTPCGRSDGKDIYIEAACGPVIYEVSRQVLIDHKLCAEGEVWAIENNNIAFGSGWHQLERNGIINHERNEMLIYAADLAYKKLGGDGQIMAMVQKHSHGNLLATQLSDFYNMEVPYISGKTPKSERTKYYEEIKNGTLKVFVASNIYNDSVSLPHVKVLINAAGGKSKISTKQRLGRALTGHKKIILVDSLDTGHKVLRKHSEERLKSYKQEGYKVVKCR